MQPSTVIKLSPEQFFAWLPGQEGRYELVDGEVVMMAGAGRRHDRLVVNLITAINLQIRGGPCQTFTSDTFVATSPSTLRMPDIGVDCGHPDDASLTADQPELVVEVLSPTTGGIDFTIKLQEYQSLASINYILLVDTESPKVHFYSRGSDRTWTSVVVDGLQSEITLKNLNLDLKLSEIYRGLEFRPRPRLVGMLSGVDDASREDDPG